MSGDRRTKKSIMVKSISRKKPGLALGTMEAPRARTEEMLESTEGHFLP